MKKTGANHLRERKAHRFYLRVLIARVPQTSTTKQQQYPVLRVSQKVCNPHKRRPNNNHRTISHSSLRKKMFTRTSRSPLKPSRRSTGGAFIYDSAAGWEGCCARHHESHSGYTPSSLNLSLSEISAAPSARSVAEPRSLPELESHTQAEITENRARVTYLRLGSAV